MRIHTVNFNVEWDKFKPYSSFFIPAMNYKYAKRIILEECRRQGVTVVARLSIEDDVRGVRVWRVYERE
jgi:hypothetical protein